MGSGTRGYCKCTPLVSSLSSKYPGGITVFGLQMEKKKSMDIHRNLSRQTIRIIINPLLKQVLGVSPLIRNTIIMARRRALGTQGLQVFPVGVRAECHFRAVAFV
jgi:hypothetical protein